MMLNQNGRALAERQVHQSVHVRTKTRLTNGWTDAHDRAPGAVPEPNLLSNGILAGPVLRGKSLIHDHGFGSGVAVCRRELPATRHRQSKRFKVSGPDDRCGDAWRRAVGIGNHAVGQVQHPPVAPLAGIPDAIVNDSRSGSEARRSVSRSVNATRSAPSGYFRSSSGTVIVSTLAVRNPRSTVCKAEQTPNEETRAHHQDQRQADLRHDECVSQEPGPTSHLSPGVLFPSIPR